MWKVYLSQYWRCGIVQYCLLSRLHLPGCFGWKLSEHGQHVLVPGPLGHVPVGVSGGYCLRLHWLGSLGWREIFQGPPSWVPYGDMLAGQLVRERCSPSASQVGARPGLCSQVDWRWKDMVQLSPMWVSFQGIPMGVQELKEHSWVESKWVPAEAVLICWLGSEGARAGWISVNAMMVIPGALLDLWKVCLGLTGDQ